MYLSCYNVNNTKKNELIIINIDITIRFAN